MAVCVDPNSRDGPAWAEGDYGQFARELRNAPRLADKTDLAARILSESLDEAVGMIPHSERASLAKAFDLPPQEQEFRRATNLHSGLPRPNTVYLLGPIPWAGGVPA